MAGLRIIFMGSPAFALPALKTLIASNHEICAVYCQPPRPAGRGQKLTPTPVHTLAEQNSLPVFHPESLKTLESQNIFLRHNADIAVVAAYGLLLPQAILDAPRMGCINIHPSALPRWRGAAPIQRTIMAGDATSECCIMQMDKGLDTGAVWARVAFNIPSDMTAGILHNAMAELGASMLIPVIEGIQSGLISPIPQSEEGITYAAKISKADLAIDWSKPAAQIYNQVRGLAPAPSVQFQLGSDVIKLCTSSIAEPSHRAPVGTLLDDMGLVACGGGTTLLLHELLRAGKNRMEFNDFIRGYPLVAGMVLT